MSTSSHCIPLAVIDFGLLILVIMAAIQMKDMEHTQTGSVPSKLCVPCEALYVNPAFKSLSSFTVTGLEGRETCCLKTGNDVGKLVELMSERAAGLRESTDELTVDEWNCLYKNTQSGTEILKLEGKTTADNVPQHEKHHARTVTHSIYRERHGHLSKLFHASESVGNTDVAPTNVTTYVGGAVHLRRGDRAMVKSYSHQWILLSVHSNFFGMFKVS